MSGDNKETEAIEVLREYVCAAEPEINSLLRSGNPDNRVFLLDYLCSLNNTVKKIYRGLPNSCISIKDGIYEDEGFLSTSESIDTALFQFTPREDAALLVITLPAGSRIIDVNQFLPCQNDEREYVLPHHTQLRIDDMRIYSNLDGNSDGTISDFEAEHQYELYQKLWDFDKLTVYYCTIIN